MIKLFAKNIFVFIVFVSSLIFSSQIFAASPQSIDSQLSYDESFFSGEYIDLFQGALTLAVEEVSIPGPFNSDVKVYREWDTSLGFLRSHLDWDEPNQTRFVHSFPRIEILGHRSVAQQAKLCEKQPSLCRYLINFSPGLLLKIPGLSPMTLFYQGRESTWVGKETAYFINPNTNWTAYIFPQNITDSNVINVRVFSPDGKRYEFSKNKVVVSDSAGNYVAYHTQGFVDRYRDSKEYVETHLKSIVTSDGRKVTFDYSYQGGSNKYFQVKSMTVHSGDGEKRVWRYESKHSVRGFKTIAEYCTYKARDAGPPRDRYDAKSSCLLGFRGIRASSDFVGDNSITKVIDPEGRETKIEYSGNKLKSFTLPDGGKIVYGYKDGKVSLRRVFDVSGDELDKVYFKYTLQDKSYYINDDNRPASVMIVEDDKQRNIYRFYDDHHSNLHQWGRIKSVQYESISGEVLRSKSYKYHAGISKCRNASRSPWQRSECIQSRTREVVYDSKFKTSYSEFDSYGFPRKVTQAGINLSREILYDYFHQSPTSSGSRHAFVGLLARKEVVGQNGAFLEYSAEYNPKGQIVKEIKSGVEKEYSYHLEGVQNKGNLKSVSFSYGGSLKKYTYSDYFRGLARLIIDPEGNSSEKDVNGFGEITRLTDPEGHSVAFEFDGLGRLVSEMADGRAPVVYGYGVGFESSKNTFSGVGSILRKDGWGRKVSEEMGTLVSEGELSPSHPSIQTLYQYSSDGLTVYEGVPHYAGEQSARFIKEVDGLNRLVSKGYDEPGAYKTTYCYQASCLPVSESDINTGGYLNGAFSYKVTTNLKSFVIDVFDGFGSDQSLLPVAHIVVDRENSKKYEMTEMSYDYMGRLTKVKKGQVERVFTYDPVYGDWGHDV